MAGLTDPFSSYVYEGTSPRKYDAQYAFRGTFDGAGHTIRNFVISKTPYYNTGLFPYAIGATIKDVKLEGSVTLTKSAQVTETYTDSEGKTQTRSVDPDPLIANVGMVGNMNGGSISGVDVSLFTIKNPNSLSTANVGNLCGRGVDENGDLKDFTEGNSTYVKSHSTEGDAHAYNANGVCLYSDCTAEFQPAALVDGVYQIANAGNLIWFANLVNSQADGNVVLNAVLTADIDLENNAYGSFPGIGVTNAKYYSGVFDGQNHTISNFYQEISNGNTRTGLFSSLKGTSTKTAVVRNLTLSGVKEYTVNASQAMHGTVVGEVEAYGLVEDVVSNVTFRNAKAFKMLGGIAGCVNKNGVINRCRFSGTIADGPSYANIGGIVGEIRGGTVSNSLFDGEIVNSLSNSEMGVGGIAGTTGTNAGSAIKNCLVHGTITLSNYAGAKSGIVLGYAATTVTITDTYYTTANVSENLTSPVGSGTTATASEVPESWEDLAETLDGDGNWEVKAGAEYPVPSKHTPKPHVHNYEENGGYCTNKGCDQHEQPATLLSEGHYEVGNIYQFKDFYAKALANPSLSVVLTGDIDIAGMTFSGFNNYTGTFDGNGHAIYGYTKIVNTNSNYRAFFNQTLSGAVVRNLTLSGVVSFTNYFSTSAAFVGGLIGKATGTTVQDVTVSVDMVFDNTVNGTVNSGIRILGGLVGSADGTTLNRCRYNGTMSLDAQTEMIGDRFGGIVGIVANKARIENCLFDGVVLNTKTNMSSIKMGGILAMGASGCTVSNCLSVGTLSLGAVNTNCGMIVGNTNSCTITNSFYTVDKFTVAGATPASGFNASGTKLTNPDWNTVLSDLGAQWHMDLEHESYPVPGVSASEHSHRTVILDDSSDFLPSLECAETIVYTRSASYMKGYISVCLPFALEPSMLPNSSCKIYRFKGVNGDSLVLEEARSVRAGEPCVVGLDAAAEGKAWTISVRVCDGTEIVTTPSNPSSGNGVYGAFNTKTIGEGYYKLNSDGTSLIKTSSSSKCYPYRAYFKAQ